MIWAAVYYKRGDDSKIEMPSWNWLLVFILITFGAILSQYDN